MGRNANGLMKSSGDGGELTVGQLGLHPKALKAFGGEKYIGGWVKEYNSALKQHLVFFRSQLANVTSKSTREIKQGHSYLTKTGWNESNIARAEVTHFHKVMKILAKKYGWDYSKKNN